MELFNNAAITAESTKHGLVTGHVFWQNTFSYFLLISFVLHATLIVWQKSAHKESSTSVYYQKNTVEGLHLKVLGSELTSSPAQEIPDVLVVPKPVEKMQTQASLEQPSQDKLLPWTLQQPIIASEASGAEQASEPVQGIPVGNSAFVGLGGSKRKAFGIVNDNANNMRGGIRADVKTTDSLNQIVQSMVKELGDDLNKQFPIEDEQTCWLQTPIVCKHSNTEFEKYLSQKTTVLRNLLGATSVKVSVYEGRWQVLLTP